jgi:threonine aldolase
LCAPVGSVLCGSREFIDKARRIRKQLGGGMRQAGVLAAAGIVALETMADRLGEDHARARALAEGLARLPHVRVDPDPPATNMVYFHLSESAPFDGAGMESRLANDGILIHAVGPRRIRLVTHFWIDDESIGRTIEACRVGLGAS